MKFVTGGMNGGGNAGMGTLVGRQGIAGNDELLLSVLETRFQMSNLLLRLGKFVLLL